MRSVVPLLVLVLAATLAAAAPAGAVSYATPFLPSAGPELAGDELVWALGRDDGGFDVVAAAAGGGPVRTLGSMPSVGGSEFSEEIVVPYVAASAQRVAAEGFQYPTSDKYSAGYYGLSTYQGPLAGPVEPYLPACGEFVTGAGPKDSVDVDGHVVAAQGYACGQAATGGRVTDFSTEPPTVRDFPDVASTLRLAGDFVAYRPVFEQGPGPYRVWVVRDRRSGDELYAVTAGDYGPARRGTAGPSFDLQADGKIVYGFAGAGREQATAAWSSASERAPHVLALPPSRSVEVRWAGPDQLLVLRVPLRGRGDAGLLELRELSGGLIRTLARDAVAAGRSFDTDGARAAWVTHACDGVRLHVEALDVEGGPAAARRRCRLRFAGPLRRTTRTRVVAPLDCRGFVVLCEASRVSIRTRVRGRWRRMDYGADTSFMVRTFRVSLLPWARRLLARRGAIRVRVAARIDGERRTGVFTLR